MGLIAELQDILHCLQDGEISEARITLERLITRIQREEQKKGETSARYQTAPV